MAILSFQDFINEAYKSTTNPMELFDTAETTPGTYVIIGEDADFANILEQAGEGALDKFTNVYSYCCYTYDDTLAKKNPEKHDTQEIPFPSLALAGIEPKDDPEDIYEIISSVKQAPDTKVLMFVNAECSDLPDIVKLKRTSNVVVVC